MALKVCDGVWPSSTTLGVRAAQQVAFQVRDSEDEYLALDKDMVVLQRLQWPSTGANAAEAIAESATWTIVGTGWCTRGRPGARRSAVVLIAPLSPGHAVARSTRHPARVEYSFYEDPALGLHQVSMRPTPIVDTIKIQTISLVELHGENFALDMRVFFGELPAVTRYERTEREPSSDPAGTAAAKTVPRRCISWALFSAAVPTGTGAKN